MTEGFVVFIICWILTGLRVKFDTNHLVTAILAVCSVAAGLVATHL